MENKAYTVGIYCRLSKDDDTDGESQSISTQRAMIKSYCKEHGYEIQGEYIDDGYSGLNFNRPQFQLMLRDIEAEKINMVITKDLSRLGRDYIMTGYYSEIFFPSKGVRYIAVSDCYDSFRNDNDIAPFRNILNDMYARDISKKVKNAKRQRAKDGLFIGSQAPYGYMKSPGNKTKLVPDPDSSEVVQLIFRLAAEGSGEIAIASYLKEKKILCPAAYKATQGDKRFLRYRDPAKDNRFDWTSSSIGKILRDRVYTGTLTSLKTEVINCKTKQRHKVPENEQLIFENAHEAIIEPELFELVQQCRAMHPCPAKQQKENLFRGLLFCSCCGHPLSVCHRKLTYHEDDLYRCMHHFRNPQECPKTHAIYHELLYDYVLKQIRLLARSVRLRKMNIAVSEYKDIEKLDASMLHQIISRIEIDHVTHKSKPSKVIHIYWKLK